MQLQNKDSRQDKLNIKSPRDAWLGRRENYASPLIYKRRTTQPVKMDRWHNGQVILTQALAEGEGVGL